MMMKYSMWILRSSTQSEATYIGTGRDHPLTAAQTSDDAKVRKYRNLSEQTGSGVVGAVMETTGALGPSLKS